MQTDHMWQDPGVLAVTGFFILLGIALSIASRMSRHD